MTPNDSLYLDAVEIVKTLIGEQQAQIKSLQERVDRYGALMFDVVSDDQIMHDDEGLIACPVCHKVHYWADDADPHEKDCTYVEMKHEASVWWSDYIMRKEGKS